MSKISAYLTTNAARFEDDLCELLRIESVSADPKRKPALQKAAAWIGGKLEALGLKTEIIPTAGHPIVFAEWAPVPGKPVVLVYGHYDVQPPEPLDLWTTPAFEPTRRNGNIYARGATDDKGQILTHIQGAEAWIRAEGSLPIQLKFVIEGEEEVGSEAIGKFLPANADRLACDCVVISDGSKFSRDIPAITYGLRGIAYYELRLTGPDRDLHSGSFGGSVTNPAIALAKMLAALVDSHGRVQVPGFYDDVLPLSELERKSLASLPFSEAEYFKSIGVSGGLGEEGYTALERRCARPTYDVCGLWSGYQGEGQKTVLPSKAGAKFSFRLVPNQSPEKISAALKKWVTENTPPGITAELIDYHGTPGVIVPLESPYVAAAKTALEQAFGRAPVYTREGGSIPIVSAFYSALHADTLLLGWGQDDDNTHSPNEKFCLADFHRGTAASAALWGEIAKIIK
jgi:succinyl-diaminopimelate desuccinylase